MVRDVDGTKDFVLNVYLRSGEQFLGVDSTTAPFGTYERMVGFWHNDAVKMYPMDLVHHVEFVFDK